MKLIQARFGEDFDAAITQPIVFGGKRILVDANFANGSLGRECAAGKSVDIDLAAVRAGRWAGKRLKFGLQLIGIIRKRFEVLSLHNHHTGVVRRSNVDIRGGIRNLHFFLFHLNEERNIQSLNLPGKDLDIFLRENSEALRHGLHGVRSRSQALKFVDAVTVGGGVQ